MQYSYSSLYKADSAGEVGTLKFFRERYGRSNVNPSKVLDSYEGSEQFLISVGKAYVIEAAMVFFGMENTNDHPQYNNFVANISHKSNEVKKEYFDRIIGQFVDQYLLIDGEAEAVRQHQQISQRAARVFADHGYSLCQENQEQEILSSEAIPEEEDDYILNYGLRILEVVMLLLQLKDTTKEGDGTRAAINEKMLMSFFKCHNNYSKYAIEMVTAITQKEILLSPRMAEVVKREPFVNWRGGIGNNMDDDMDDDMAIEICNSVTKRMVHGMGANKTVNAIDLASTASVGIEDITSNYDKASSNLLSPVNILLEAQGKMKSTWLQICDGFARFERFPAETTFHFQTFQKVLFQS